uniref:Uncharacterized protein n=1 Tax=Rhinolophus ferrumequinum TaxID=59479 RepID=A0A671EH57_RHIFE
PPQPLATKRRTLFPILYTSRVPPSSSGTNLYSKHHRDPKLFTLDVLTTTPISFLKQHLPMTSMHNGIYSKNATLRLTPLTTKSTRRSTNLWVHSPSSCRLKLGGYRMLRMTALLNPITDFMAYPFLMWSL